MTILDRLHDIGFASAAGLGGELLLKATAVLAAALVLDFLLHRRWLLTCSATWNGALVLLALLPIACVMLPAKRVASTTSVASTVASATAEPPAVMPSSVMPAPTNLLPSSPDPVIDLPIDDGAEEPSATQISTKAPTQAAEDASAPVPAPASSLSTLLALAAKAQPWLVPGLVAVYLAGVAVLTLRLMMSLFAVARLRRRSQAVTIDDWRERLAAWRTRFGVRRAVQLRHSGDVTVPLVIGFCRPAIIVPSDMLESAGGARRDAILAHELAHIVRGDLGWQLLERVVGALLWFHPLLWYAGRRIGLVRERICDGFAVHHLGRRNDYVETLLEMATRLTSRRGLSLGLAVLRTSQLGERLASVQKARSMERCQLRPTARLAILVLTAAAALWAGRAAVAVEPVPQVAGLPGDAQALLAGYQQKSAEMQAEVDRKTAAHRDALIQSLQALQDQYTRQAKLDEAVAIRDQLRLLKSPKTGIADRVLLRPPLVDTSPSIIPPDGTGMLPPPINGNPLSMIPFRKSIGKVFLIEVTGAESGAVWGDSEDCTDDSSLAAAAVQFGVLRPGERGMIKVTIHSGKPRYAGFSGHGITSQPWDNTNGTYASLKIEAAPNGAYQACHENSGAAPGGGGLESETLDRRVATLANFVGSTFVFETKGQVNGGVWGTDQYTHDSTLGAAAVHAGALQAGQTGYVFMNVKPGIPLYRGSTRNGVTSTDWNNAGNSFVTLTFQSPSAAAEEAVARPTVSDYLPRTAIRARPASEASPDLFRRSVGQTLYFHVTGAAEGNIWGCNPYTDDSPLGAAVIHAGILSPGEEGIIKVHVEPALDNYPGSTQNGVTSLTWNSGGGYVALRLSRVPIRRGFGGRAATPREQVLPDPGALTNYAKSVGQSFSFRVTGGTDGNVWGTDVYTHDSTLAAAAVHAGVLRAGETGVVKVTMLPGLPQYHGSTNNGVTSRPWENDGSYASYQVERADRLRAERLLRLKEGAWRSGGRIEDLYEGQNRGGTPPAAPGVEAPAGAPLGYNTWSAQAGQPPSVPPPLRADGVPAGSDAKLGPAVIEAPLPGTGRSPKQEASASKPDTRKAAPYKTDSPR